jgi:hypothetical protein
MVKNKKNKRETGTRDEKRNVKLVNELNSDMQKIQNALDQHLFLDYTSKELSR